jgi:DnaJ-domain-containing protein 1
METEFQVERGSFSTAQATCDAVPSVDPNRQENSGQLLPDCHQFLGDDAEPDTLFFVESWTFGVPKAVENARQRQRGKPDREQQSRLFHQFANLGSQFYVEEALRTAEQFRSSHNPDGAPMHREWFSAQAYGVAPQDSEDWREGCDDNHETSLPVTHDHACRILGVPTRSTRGEIKAAYRRMVNRWHPDRLECKAEEERQIATLKMTAINQAYRLLCSDLRKPA